MSREISGQLECPSDCNLGRVRLPGQFPVAGTVQEGIVPRMEFGRNRTGDGSRARSTRRNRSATQKGVILLKTVAASHRDPRLFPDPGRSDAARRPNRHLSFGLGVHVRAGNSHARMGAAIAFRKLFGRFPGLQFIASPDIAARLWLRETRQLHVAVK